MHKTVPTILSLSLLLGGTRTLQAADASNANKPDAMARLFGKLADVMLGPPDPKHPVNLAAQVIFAVPGMPIPDAGLDSTSPADMVFLNNTLDAIPGKSLYYQDSLKTYSGVYADILNNSMVAAAKYTADEQAQIENLRKELDPSSDKMTAYLAGQKAYDDAVDAYNSYLSTAANKKPSKTVTDNVANALLHWQTAGYMAQIKADKVTFNTLNNRGSASWWSNLVDTMNGRMADTTTPMVITYPKPENWGSGCTWTKFTWSTSDSVKSSNANSKAVEAAVSYNGGGLSLAASGGWAKATQDAFAGDASTSIEVELARVLVYRPWMDTNVFSSSAWNYQGTLLTDKTPVISDNKELMQNTGLMPLIVDQVWLARNLKVKGHWAAVAANTMKQNIHAELAIGYGPFALTGFYNQADQSSNWSSHAIDDGIEADGIQAIAFMCSVVPACPSFVQSTDASAQPPAKLGKKVVASTPAIKAAKEGN